MPNAMFKIHKEKIVLDIHKYLQILHITTDGVQRVAVRFGVKGLGF